MKGCAVMIRFVSFEYTFTAVHGPQLYNKMIHKAFCFDESQKIPFDLLNDSSSEKVLTGNGKCSVKRHI